MNPSLPDFRLLPEKTLLAHLVSFSVDLHTAHGFYARQRNSSGRNGTVFPSAVSVDFRFFQPVHATRNRAAVAVPAVDRVSVEVLQVPAGLYAVFLHLGGPAGAGDLQVSFSRLRPPAISWTTIV
ncbi:MAG: GyrI-like domain-containing protein [Bacteroidales bacterium]